MKEFINFIKSAHFFLLFLVLESFSIFLIVKNTDKKLVFLNSANSVSGFFHKESSYISDYFSLRTDNQRLIKENNRLKNYITLLKPKKHLFSADLENIGYYYKYAEVVKNSVNKPNNILTVNKGSSDGIYENMAVVSDEGIVGITAIIGKRYTTVISVLNSKLGISAKIKRTGFHGIIKWDEKNPEYVLLTDIPVYTSLYKGDEVVTGGYSAIFPEGMKIGTVSEFKKDKQSTFFIIKVKLSQDFRKLNNVYLVDYKGRKERIQIEDSTFARYRFNNSD
ncbi:MAG: rod shape-determining protein MreC [Bacteroidales bacterium]|nr:rod shape-determining protein MreC [Bacteroidales bacterium]